MLFSVCDVRCAMCGLWVRVYGGNRSRIRAILTVDEGTLGWMRGGIRAANVYQGQLKKALPFTKIVSAVPDGDDPLKVVMEFDKGQRRYTLVDRTS